MSLLKSPFGVRATFGFAIAILRSSTQRKYLHRWIQSLQEGYLLNAPSPWITFDAIEFITARLQPQANVFEFGSGGSTLYWLSRGAVCVSIEHDPGWYEILRKRLPGDKRVDYRLVLPEKNTLPADVDPADPAQYASADPHFVGQSFQRYVTQIDAFPDAHFDLIVVDGRARPSCLAHGLPKVKPGGMIVLDNAERAYYTEKAPNTLTAFQKHALYGVTPSEPRMTCTNVYIAQ